VKGKVSGSLAILRHARGQSRLSLRRPGEALEHAGVGRSRRHGVHANGRAGSFKGGGLGQPLHGMLARHVDRSRLGAFMTVVEEMLTMLPLPETDMRRTLIR
jgi:hypothetical protein